MKKTQELIIHAFIACENALAAGKVYRYRFHLITLLMIALTIGCRKSNELFPPTADLGKDVYAKKKNIPEFPSDPNDFVAQISNPTLPSNPGRCFITRAKLMKGLRRFLVEVTDDKLTILGIAMTVIHDQVFLGGELIEDTYDWYAQDKEGNVWYFGEDSKEIENGVVVST